MKKYFIVSDVHSFYDELQAALKLAGFDIDNPEHIFVSLGDLLDRGQKPLECLNFVNGLPADRKILVRGNHEDLLASALLRGNCNQTDVYNGTAETVYLLSGITNNRFAVQSFSQLEAWKNYFYATVDYAEIGDSILTHAWLPENYALASHRQWLEARWLNPFACWREKPLVGKSVICGHYSVSYGHAYFHQYGLPDYGTLYSFKSESPTN